VADKTTKLTFAAKTTGTQEVEALGRTIGELGKIDAFRKLNADAKASLKTWKDAEAEVRRLAAEMKKAEKPTAAMRREFERSKKTAAKLKSEYENTRRRINGLRASMQKSGIDTKNLVTEQKRLKAALKSVRTEAGRAMKVDAARGLLDVRPHKEIQREIKRTRLAYERLKKSGKLTSSELAAANVKMKARIAELRAETRGWGQSFGFVRTKILALAAGGYAALRGFSATTDVLKKAELAAFNMEKSVEAANREFENTGSLDHWQNAVRRLSDELKIYSDSSIKNAISRTVDMTKRLGLSTDQMEEVIRRSADLGAGKVELEGAIERVTAALRGEAESAEYLGLTLNENYIKAWYEASGATQGAWKDLNDLQKAQIRYAVFLEQSAEMQGRAAASAETYAGALAIVKKEIENAIVNNPEVIASMQALGKVLRENADEIGALVGGLVQLVGALVKFAAENQGVVKGLGAGLVALLAWKAGIGDIITGTIGLAGKMRMATTAGGLMTGALGRLAAAGQLLIRMAPQLAAVWGVFKIGQAAKGFMEMRAAQKSAAAATERLLDVTARAKERFAEFADVEIVGDIWQKPTEDLEKYKSELAKARAYYTALASELEVKSRETGFFGRQTEAAREARKELDRIKPRYDAIAEAAREVNRALAERDRITAESIDDIQAPPEIKLPVTVDKTKLDKSIDTVKDRMTDLPDKKTVAVSADVAGTAAVENLIRAIARLKDKTITITTVQRTVEQYGAGGMVGALARMAAGGAIGGKPHAHGGTVIEAERGEYIHPVKSVHYYGVRVMEAIRRRLIDPALLRRLAALPKFEVPAPRVDLSGLMPVGKYAAGGMVGGIPSDLGTLNLTIGRTSVRGYFQPDVVAQIEAAIRREKRMRRNY